MTTDAFYVEITLDDDRDAAALFDGPTPDVPGVPATRGGPEK